MTTEAPSTTATNEQTAKTRGPQPDQRGKQPRVIRNPNDVAGLVLMQIDAVNARKDELTIAVKGLADTAKQLVRAYAEQAQAIAKLAKRVQELEAKAGEK